MSTGPRRVYTNPRPPSPEGRMVNITAAMVPHLQTILASSLSDPNGAQYAEKNFNLNQPGGIDDQCWRFIAEIGELGHAYTWFSNSLSRIRLYAATIGPNSVDVVPIESGPAADIVNQLRWDSGAIMKEIAWNRLAVGRAYLLGNEIDDTFREWSVYSTTQIRKERRGPGYEITYDGVNWERLPPNSMLSVSRIEDPRRKWLDWSPTKNILPILREIDLYNKKIIASLISRIVSRGILFIPAEVTFPNRKEQRDGADPFVEEFLDAAKSAIRDPSSAAAGLPLPLRVPAASIEKFRHMMLEQSEEVDTIKDRESALYRMADSLPIPRELVVGGLTKANHWCVVDTTQILTLNGWKTQENLQVGDVCLTLNHETGMSEWQPVLDIYRADVVNEPMIHMENMSHSSTTTFNHRWPIEKAGKKVSGSRRRWTTSDSFSTTDRVPVAAQTVGLPTDTKYSDDFVRLIAAWTSDGTLYEETATKSRRARIVKFDDTEINVLRSILVSVFGDRYVTHAWTEHAHRTAVEAGWAFEFSGDSLDLLLQQTGEHKAIRLSFIHDLTYAQRELLLRSMIEIGDGVIGSDGNMCFYQVEPTCLDALELAAITCGYKVMRGQRSKNTGWGERPLHYLKISKKRLTFIPTRTETTEVRYTGLIWCPVTQNQTWLAKSENGHVFFTGNTSWQLTEDAIKTYISPDAESISRSLTKSFLWPQMKAEGHPIVDGDGNRTIIWYDATALTVSPDRSAQAREAFDRIEISGEAYRREIGFTEEDKPSPEEIAYRVKQKRLIDKFVTSDGPVGEGDLVGDEKLGLPRTKGNQAPKVGQEA